MSDKPAFGLSVADLGRSIQFYRDQIGLNVQTDTGMPDTAVITTSQNQQFLLAGSDAPAWPKMLADGYTILKPGEKIFMEDPEFEDRLSRLSADETIAFELIERPLGDRIIEADCPDGYGVSLLMTRDRSRDEILELIRCSRDGFRRVTHDLTRNDQCWRPGPDEWSIREVVHHVADASLTVLHAVRAALAAPGKTYHGNPYDQRQYADALRYQERKIESSLQLIESIHDTLVSLVEAIPDAWQRHLISSSCQETSVETYLLMLAAHNLEHLEQINDIRSALDYPRYSDSM